MKIATLGPTGTFSELAARKYLTAKNMCSDIVLYPTIAKAFHAANTECDLSIIPIENLLDGFVHGVLDLLVKTELYIIGELVVPVQFSFIANGNHVDNVTHIYAQYKSQGQCCDFLEPYESKIITTESNSASFEKVQLTTEKVGAIVPFHMVNKDDFNIVIPQVTDSTENETRFIILGKKEADYSIHMKYKTSIVVTSATDKPGLLSTILGTFSTYKINLTSIISRPTKQALGKYYFFIDFEGHYPNDNHVFEAINSIQIENSVKILGSYTLIQ